MDLRGDTLKPVKASNEMRFVLNLEDFNLQYLNTAQVNNLEDKMTQRTLEENCAIEIAWVKRTQT